MKSWVNFLVRWDFIFESYVRDKCGKCGCFAIKGTISGFERVSGRFDGILWWFDEIFEVWVFL
nr:MAG TPA: hypothetical protein [Caudoviricetes sp.]